MNVRPQYKKWYVSTKWKNSNLTSCLFVSKEILRQKEFENYSARTKFY